LKLKNIRNHFAAGLLVLAPLFLTTIFIGYLVRLADGFIVNPVFRVLPFHLDASSKVFLAKVAIAVVVVVFVTGIGWAAERFLFKQLFSSGESFIESLPMINKIYASIKDITLALFGEKKGEFARVVFVVYPMPGTYSMGFVTNTKRWEIDEKTGKEMVTVFIPSPPNPATGYFIFVEKDKVIESSMTIEEGVRMVLSVGAAPPVKKESVR
jgi:uncharacterized membrane protein